MRRVIVEAGRPEGTRFIASRECVAHEKYRYKEGEDLPFGAAREQLQRAWIEGDMGAYILPAGEVLGMIREVKSVGEIIREMVGEDAGWA